MKRMEELIHLNKKINFEGKVSSSELVLLYTDERWSAVKISFPLNIFLWILFSSFSPFCVDLSSDLSVPLAGETRWTPGGGHSDDEYLWIKVEAPHQACVPPSVQRQSPAVQEERVSDVHQTQRDREHCVHEHCCLSSCHRLVNTPAMLNKASYLQYTQASGIDFFPLMFNPWQEEGRAYFLKCGTIARRHTWSFKTTMCIEPFLLWCILLSFAVHGSSWCSFMPR